MNLYTLDSNFLKQEVVDGFESVVWTERFSKAGDITVTSTPTSKMLTQLQEGTRLYKEGSQEVMVLDSVLNENGMLKATGPGLVKVLEEKVFRNSENHDQRHAQMTQTPIDIVRYVVGVAVMPGEYLGSGDLGIHNPKQKIPNLLMDWSDTEPIGPEIDMAVPFGPVYSIVEQLAETYAFGFRMYLFSADDSGYELMFKIYEGVDRTSTGETNLVRFSPVLGSLENVSELRSNAAYKNVAYAFAPSAPFGVEVGDFPVSTPPGVAYADAEASDSIGLDRRVIMVFADDITTDQVGGNAALLSSMLDQRAKDALANHNFTRVVDGEATAQSEYKFGIDYFLGDIVELEGYSGLIQKARITEYITTQDNTGERSYPTVSVIE